MDYQDIPNAEPRGSDIRVYYTGITCDTKTVVVKTNEKNLVIPRTVITHVDEISVWVTAEYADRWDLWAYSSRAEQPPYKRPIVVQIHVGSLKRHKMEFPRTYTVENKKIKIVCNCGKRFNYYYTKQPDTSVTCQCGAEYNPKDLVEKFYTGVPAKLTK